MLFSGLLQRSRRQRVRTPVRWTDKRAMDLGPIHASLSANEAEIRQIWSDCDDFACTFSHIGRAKFMFVTVSTLIDDHLIQDVVGSLHQKSVLKTIDDVKDALNVSKSRYIDSMREVVSGLCEGAIVLFLAGQRKAVMVETHADVHRAIDKPEMEPDIFGPQEAFIENLPINITMLRSRLKSPKLKVSFLQIGELTHTKVAIVYLDGVIKSELVDEVRTRLNKIHVDGIVDSNYVVEWISDGPRSLFPTIQQTERPDRVAAALLQGQFCVMVDGSPLALIAPVGLYDLLEAPEDFYSSYLLAFPLRLLRHSNFWISLLAPSVYIALLSFQQEMIPTRLLISLQTTHEGIPFPTIIEAFIMELAFESLREAGIRLPKAIGQSVSIVGALIIGDAAVNADIVSPGMVIVVALTGIASFSLPSYQLAFATRVLRFPCMISAGLFGLYGVAVFLIVILSHLMSLRSFGIPYVDPFASKHTLQWTNAMFRPPLWARRERPMKNEPEDVVRSYQQKPGPSNGKSNA